MSALSPNLRGIVLMALATLTFVINDTFLKLATVGLPPLQVLFMRGVFASLWCLPLVLFTGNGTKLHFLVDRWVLLRNGFELFSILMFVIALANMPIADLTALGQVAPMLLLVGVAIVFGDRIGPARMVLIALGFVGALLVAQPGGAGFSIYVVMGFLSAMATAARDVTGRRIGAHVPSLVVAFCALLLVMLGAGVVSLIFETWAMPDFHHILLLIGSGFFLTLGHTFIFMSYRTGATGAVAPFYYTFTVWAVVSGIVVFGTVPNLLAIGGMVLILASGITVAVMDERRRRLLVTA